MEFSCIFFYVHSYRNNKSATKMANKNRKDYERREPCVLKHTATELQLENSMLAILACG